MLHADRINPYEVAPDAMKAFWSVERYIRQCGLEQSLVELVKMRASQINGCAFCLDLHAKDARKAGESEQRLYLLGAWREAHVFSRRERAALAWTDALTTIADTHAPDAVYDAVRPHFTDKELADLSALIGLINAWNRLATGLRYRHG